MKYEYQIQVKEHKRDKWRTIYYTLRNLLMCQGKEITKEQYYTQKELNEICYKKCHEIGNFSLLNKCKIIMEEDVKYWEL